MHRGADARTHRRPTHDALTHGHVDALNYGRIGVLAH